MKFINIILDMFTILTSFIIPKRIGLYALGASHGDRLTGNPKYFYNYLIHNKQPAVWVTGNRELYRTMKQDGLPVVYKYSLPAFWIMVRAQFLIIEQMPKDILFYGMYSVGRFSYIQTFHGIGVKKIGLDAAYDGKGISCVTITGIIPVDNVLNTIKTVMKKYFLYKNYREVIVTSELTGDIAKTAFQNKSIRILGYPRNDILFDKKRSDGVHQAQFAHHDKVFGYFPTFRDNYGEVSPFTDRFFDSLQREFEKRNWFLLIKKHPYEEAIKIPDYLKNIQDISEMTDEVQEFLTEIDVLITDYSSVANDFCLTDKPIIFYIYDIEQYQEQCRGFYYDIMDKYSGPFAKTEKKMLDLMITVDEWATKPSYLKKYSKMKKVFNTYADGKSSQRLLTYLSGGTVQGD